MQKLSKQTKNLHVFFLLHTVSELWVAMTQGGLILLTCTNRNLPNFKDFKASILFMTQTWRKSSNTAD